MPNDAPVPVLAGSTLASRPRALASRRPPNATNAPTRARAQQQLGPPAVQKADDQVMQVIGTGRPYSFNFSAPRPGLKPPSAKPTDPHPPPKSAKEHIEPAKPASPTKSALRAEITAHAASLTELQTSNLVLREANTELEEINTGLTRRNAALSEKVHERDVSIDDLEARLREALKDAVPPRYKREG